MTLRLSLPGGTRARTTDAVCGLGGALTGMLALARAFAPVAEAIRTVTGASERLQPYIAFTLVTAAALTGVVAALSLLVGLRRLGKGGLAPAVVLVLLAAFGLHHARWLVWAAPLFAVVGAPFFVTARVRAVPATANQRTMALVCTASEAACVGMGAWFPYAAELPAMLLPIMGLAAALATYAAAAHASDETRWRAVLAGMPCLLLPFVGLERNPTGWPTCVALALAVSVLVAGAWRPAWTGRLEAWAHRHAATFALPALLLVLVVPWHFRDSGTADLAGHEGQHYGWINSIAFGKLMMADAGFTYGPAREYGLAALAWAMGGLTIEHIRLAHVVVNVVGLVVLFAAMRRVCAGQIHALLLGLGLIVTHTALVSFVVYMKTYAFGWADECRAAIPTLGVVLALTRPLDGSRRARRQLLGAGALTALAILYSHDFGVPAALGTWIGIASEALVPRAKEPWRSRARAARRDAGLYAAGLAILIAPFLLFYAAHGKLGALLRGYRWTVQVSSGHVPFPGREWAYSPALDSLFELRRHWDKSDTYIVARGLDFVLAPGLAILGLGHATAALVRRAFTRRTPLILALSVFVAALMHHAFLAADPWHIANATAPGLVLLVALGTGGRRIVLRAGGRRTVAVGVAAAALLPALWLANGSAPPIEMRLARIATGEERPSVGPPYSYVDEPRAGDVQIGKEHLEPVAWIRAHTKPDDPVFCTTWMLGGGTEAFLADRRNPTSFDKPDEVAGPAQRAQLRGELEAHPPVLIVGGFFDYMDDATRKLIDRGWHVAATEHVPMRLRNR
ncbi:MAG TPA: hypothetical protein VIY73_11010 [Polyangiaceae bacterium]